MVRIAIEIARLYTKAEAHWKEHHRAAHRRIVASLAHRAAFQEGVFHKDGEICNDKLFEEVWSYIFHRWMSKFAFPPVERVEMEIPKGVAGVMDNFTLHGGSAAKTHKVLYRLHMYVRQDLGKVMADEAMKPENYSFNIHTDAMLFPILKYLQLRWELE